MKRYIVAISTIIQRKTHYVKIETQLANGELSPELTTREEEIKEYEDHQHAAEKLRKFRDPFAREYRIETIAVWHKKRVVNLQTDLR